MTLIPTFCLVCLILFFVTGVNGTITYAKSDSLCVSGICFPLCSEASISSSTVSGAEPGAFKEYAMDGNLSTYWVDWGSGSFLELDLGEPQVVCSVELAWPYGNARIWNYDISSVNDSKVTSLSSGTSSGNISGLERYDLPDTISEVVKITVNGNSETNYSGISEVKVFSRIN